MSVAYMDASMLSPSPLRLRNVIAAINTSSTTQNPHAVVSRGSEQTDTGARPGMVEQEPNVDLALVQRVQAGDKRAFDLLVRKYQHKLTSVISRYIHDWAECQDVADWAECQDVAQESFIRAYRALGNFRGDAQFYTWLYKIGVNTAKNHLVAKGRRPPTDDIDAGDAVQYDGGVFLRDVDTPEHELARQEMERIVTDTVAAS